MQKNCKRQMKKDRKNNREKGDKLYVNWKGYENLFNSLVDKKNVIYIYIYIYI